MQAAPKVSSFESIEENRLFLGRAKLINIQFTPAFGRKGKSGIQLFNATCVIKDVLSEKLLNLKWFNTYPSLKKQLENLEEFTFLGQVTLFKQTLQIVNPQINPKEATQGDRILIEYPTVNSVPGKQIEKIIKLIPKALWDMPIFDISLDHLQRNIDMNQAFQIKHGLRSDSVSLHHQADELLKYHEFFYNQLKILARKLKNKGIKAPQFSFTEKERKNAYALLPYELTKDQDLVLTSTLADLSAGRPMMRMIQGDVGCGKTTIAIVSAYLMALKKAQVALMCPTEALAIQHGETFHELFEGKINIALLLGSTKKSQREAIHTQLLSGDIDLIIGTHSLIQDSVKFKNLALAIIDEQHKFGVEQRQKLSKKGDGVHTLIMSATPIPRTRQLVQYGDLDISTIRVMPSGRKGTKTRIVTSSTYQKYLSFIKTRVSIGEQVYVVAPAIEENEALNLKNVTEIHNIYKKYFPDLKIGILHGQLKSEEKQETLKKFERAEIHILISTTVIEVGINILNSTVISIYNPDRFGLSSLHQLRGRVGRGEKAGFCFLISDKTTSPEAMLRLKVIEKTSDGFEIAEADLKNRGQGDIFGKSQSGHATPYRIANIFDDFKLFEQVNRDIEDMKQNKTEILNNFLHYLLNDSKVSSTI
jgi:ATP-dependent DNA helicase RecG